MAGLVLLACMSEDESTRTAPMTVAVGVSATNGRYSTA